MFYCSSTVIIQKYKNMNYYLKVLYSYNTGIESLFTKYNGCVILKTNTSWYSY